MWIYADENREYTYISLHNDMDTPTLEEICKDWLLQDHTILSVDVCQPYFVLTYTLDGS